MPLTTGAIYKHHTTWTGKMIQARLTIKNVNHSDEQDSMDLITSSLTDNLVDEAVAGVPLSVEKRCKNSPTFNLLIFENFFPLI